MGQGFKLKDSWRLRVLLGPPLEVPEFLRIPRYFHEKHQNNSKTRKIEKKEPDRKVLCGALGFKPAYLRKSIGPYKHVSAQVCARNGRQVDFEQKIGGWL